MDIEATIAEATGGVQPTADTSAEPTQETEVTEAETQPEPQESEEAREIKRLKNALSYRNKKLAKTAAELAEMSRLRQEVESLRQPKSQPDRPKAENFNTHEEYLEALTDWKWEQKTAESKREEKETSAKESARNWRNERGALLDENADKAKAAFSDFETVFNEYGDGFSTLPQHVKDAVLELDNGAYAMYQAIKDGVIDELADMSATRAAMVLARMEDKAMAAKKPITKAPAPFAPAKGTAPLSKSIENMSPDEILNLIRN